MIKSEDIKVTVTFTPGYQERYTAACLRVLEPRQGTARIGRVLTAPEYRGTGLGEKLLHQGIQTAWDRTGAHSILLDAQTYAQGFYERSGFHRTEKPEFLEDGIPHVEMFLKRI